MILVAALASDRLKKKKKKKKEFCLDSKDFGFICDGVSNVDNYKSNA